VSLLVLDTHGCTQDVPGGRAERTRLRRFRTYSPEKSCCCVGRGGVRFPIICSQIRVTLF
jgi:hypothetical protein